MSPDGSTTKPDPRECTRGRCAEAPSSRPPKKKSSSGEPGGSSGVPGPFFSALFSGSAWVVEMLTTAGTSLSASSAKDSGRARACACACAGSVQGPPSAAENERTAIRGKSSRQQEPTKDRK